MERQIGFWQLFGFATVSLCGTVLHFLYEWTGESVWAAVFSGVNESTWEHMKLLFWPTFVYAAVQSLFFRERKDFWRVKLCGISLGLLMIPLIFCTYNGVIGKSPDWFNVSIFFICAAIAYLFETRLFTHGGGSQKSSKGAFLLLCLIAVLFVIFTFIPPKIELFRDPLTSSYGV